MKRVLFATLAVVAFCPALAQAQFQPDFGKPSYGPRFRIMPFFGIAAPTRRHERWQVAGPSGTVTGNFNVDLAAGPLGGVSFEYRALDRFAIVASGSYLSRGRTTEVTLADDRQYQHEGSNFLLTKVALALHLNEQTSELQMHSLSATIFVGPSFIHEMPKNDVLADAALLQPLTYYGADFGLDTEVPLPWSGLTFQAGIEDFLVMWDNAELARRNDQVFAKNGLQTQSYVETDASHNLVFRAGLAIRFH